MGNPKKSCRARGTGKPDQAGQDRWQDMRFKKRGAKRVCGETSRGLGKGPVTPLEPCGA